MMIRRRTASLGLMSLLASCSTPDAKPIPGIQIPVLPDQSGMEPSSSAPDVVLPPAKLLSDWPQPLANPAHVPGNVAGPLGFAHKWHTDIGDGGGYRQPLAASPIVAEGRVYTMDANAHIRAFSLVDGTQIWHTTARPPKATGQNLGGGIAYGSGMIYVSTGFAEMLALEAATGKLVWRGTSLFPARSAPLVAGGVVAVVVQNGMLLSYDPKTGAEGWQFSGSVGTPPMTAVGVTGAPAYADGIIVAGFSTGVLAAIDANSGTPIWEQSLAAGFGQASSLDMADIVAAPIIAGGVVYALNLSGTFMAVDLHSGAKVWTHQATGNHPPAAAGGFLFLLDNKAQLYAVHADDGLVRWSTALPGFKNMKKKKNPIIWAGPTLINGMLVAVSDTGEAAIVDARTGQLQHITKLGAPADIPPLAVGGMLLQLTRNARLTAYG